MSEVAIDREKDPYFIFARWLSWIFIPPIVSLMTFTILMAAFRSQNSIQIWISCFLFATALPLLFIGWLHLKKKLSHPSAPVKEERTVPYFFGILFYALGAMSLLHWQSSALLWGLMICYSVNTAITLLINLRWKISAHMMGIAGPLAVLSLGFGWWVTPFYFLIPLLGWSRIKLQAHSYSQVVAGVFFGYFATLIEMRLILNFIVLP